MKYDSIFITNLASFYKINLFNRINEKKRIMVIFTMESEKTRNEDFYSDNFQFDFLFLKGCLFKRIKILWKILKNNTKCEVILSGWDSIESWFTLFISPKANNSCIVESSNYESRVSGYKGILKKIFLNRINTVYVPGKSNEALLHSLNFEGTIIHTGGVGIMNFQVQPPYYKKEIVKKFLYVGRFVEVKNLKFLIECFNSLPHLDLNIIGFGEQESELKALAKENIHFLGPVDNVKLPYYYKNNDVFILPSKSEPWGLVIEEALIHGLPVIVSDKVGCKDDLVTEETGLVFDVNDINNLREKIKEMTDVEFYNQLRKNITSLNFEERNNFQVSAYL